LAGAEEEVIFKNPVGALADEELLDAASLAAGVEDFPIR
jgi:hypothetical protein